MYNTYNSTFTSGCCHASYKLLIEINFNLDISYNLGKNASNFHLLLHLSSQNKAEQPSPIIHLKFPEESAELKPFPSLSLMIVCRNLEVFLPSKTSPNPFDLEQLYFKLIILFQFASRSASHLNHHIPSRALFLALKGVKLRPPSDLGKIILFHYNR